MTEALSEQPKTHDRVMAALAPYLASPEMTEAAAEAVLEAIFNHRARENIAIPAKGACLNFIGIDPELRNGRYSYEPTDTFFLEIGLDGQHYRIDVGNLGHLCSDGKARRGLHIFHPMYAERGEYSVNAMSIANAGELKFWRSAARSEGHAPERPMEELVELYTATALIVSGLRHEPLPTDKPVTWRRWVEALAKTAKIIALTAPGGGGEGPAASPAD